MTLAKNGFHVSLIVPHETDGVVRGVRIKAVPPPASGGERLTVTLWRIFRAALREDPRAVFHVHDAELLPYALILAVLGRRVIYDAHEDTPRQVVAQHWIPRSLRPAFSVYYETLERLGDRIFDHIFAAWPGIAKRYSPDKTTLLRNYPSKSEFEGIDVTTYRRRENLIVYAGGITEARGIFELLEACGRIPGRLDARFALAGAFYPADLEDRVRRHPQWERVTFHGWLGRRNLVEVMSRASIGYCVLLPTPQHVISYPNKLFEYMAAGLPVVASDFPVWRKIVEEAECGLLVDPRDPQQIAEAITFLLDHPDEAAVYGRSGREEFLQRRTWEGEADRLLAVYRQVLDSERATRRAD